MNSQQQMIEQWKALLDNLRDGAADFVATIGNAPSAMDLRTARDADWVADNADYDIDLDYSDSDQTVTNIDVLTLTLNLTDSDAFADDATSAELACWMKNFPWIYAQSPLADHIHSDAKIER